MSFFKLTILLFSSVSFHLCLGDTASASPEDEIMVTSIRERIWRYAGIPSNRFLKGTAWLSTAAETTVIVSSLRDAPRPAFLNALGPAHASTLTLPFVLGATLIIAGGFVRVKSFHALGPYFTFEPCIRKEHKLITHGPYAIVRHPGYSGLLISIIGWYIVHGDSASWLRMSGVLDVTWIRVWFVFWFFLMGACIVTVLRRSTEEDQFLSLRFGREWEGWARRVKYKLIPFIY